MTGKNYFLDHGRFKKICQDASIKKESSRENALEFLHDLGLVLHFREVKGYDYYVLNPYWITYGVYQILTSEKAGKLHGIIPNKQLDYIVNKEKDKKRVYKHANFKKIEYDEREREFLVEILHQFKLCFKLPKKDRFIIPDLLNTCLLYTSPSPRDQRGSRMPSSA